MEKAGEWEAKGALSVAIFAALAMVSAGTGIFPISSKAALSDYLKSIQAK